MWSDLSGSLGWMTSGKPCSDAVLGCLVLVWFG